MFYPKTPLLLFVLMSVIYDVIFYDRVVILISMVAPMALHKVKKLNTARYESFIKSNPPMTRSEVLSVFQSYIE